jgi:AbrB family looped-hinge helix DNA binding protein
VTTNLSERGQVVIPKEIRELNHWQKGDDLIVMRKPNGDVLLRRIKSRPERSLLEHLRALRGLEIPERHCPLAPRA